MQKAMRANKTMVGSPATRLFKRVSLPIQRKIAGTTIHPHLSRVSIPLGGVFKFAKIWVHAVTLRQPKMCGKIPERGKCQKEYTGSGVSSFSCTFLKRASQFIDCRDSSSLRTRPTIALSIWISNPNPAMSCRSSLAFTVS
jgi:hypothetical protein